MVDPAQTPDDPDHRRGGGGDNGTLSATVYDAILEGIVVGSFPARSRLPSELELAARFGVSRPVVRQALARLREDGLLVSRRGSGSFVQRQPAGAVLRITPVSSVADVQRCFEFRIGLEGEIASLAASRRDEASLQNIKNALSALDILTEGSELGADTDYEFHLALAEATQNRFYIETMRTLSASVVKGMELARSLSLRRPRERLLLVQSEHQRIFEAVENEAPQQAREAMRNHLQNAKTRVFDGD
ncbi:MAG: FadR/GntR family transcriptional regulator [Pseudomonadota bacterium]